MIVGTKYSLNTNISNLKCFHFFWFNEAYLWVFLPFSGKLARQYHRANLFSLETLIHWSFVNSSVFISWKTVGKVIITHKLVSIGMKI